MYLLTEKSSEDFGPISKEKKKAFTERTMQGVDGEKYYSFRICS